MSPAIDCLALDRWLTMWYAQRMTTVQVAVRLPAEQVERIDQIVGALHSSRSGVIRRALELYLYRLECERDACAYEQHGLTDVELALADDPEAWKGTPAW